jgi:hypothetical protein
LPNGRVLHNKGMPPTPAPSPALPQPDQPCLAVLDGVLKRVCNPETGYMIARARVEVPGTGCNRCPAPPISPGRQADESLLALNSAFMAMVSM